ncbi:unnamed protein product [Protopolystoma xenopodis]|uniref:Uncharacterized protein n=1 Tax=Protopolystoma xenopodis TaxID=117903 RepID=A0A3S5FGX4_9PLAT|nr:unnamed protein product [Protopolystoma xenopodis]
MECSERSESACSFKYLLATAFVSAAADRPHMEILLPANSVVESSDPRCNTNLSLAVQSDSSMTQISACPHPARG